MKKELKSKFSDLENYTEGIFNIGVELKKEFKEDPIKFLAAELLCDAGKNGVKAVASLKKLFESDEDWD